MRFYLLTILNMKLSNNQQSIDLRRLIRNRIVGMADVSMVMKP
jgi:hypothetical protein